MSNCKILVVLVLLTGVGCTQTARTLVAPFEISEAYVASGYMGDGETGAKYVQMRRVSGEMRRAGSTSGICTKVTYQPGSKGWAGVYWLSPADNWGDKPGNKIQRATLVTFWAAGAKGGEIVQFKAGGVSGKHFRDSFEKSIGAIALTKDWKQYSISLKDQNLSSVLGAFAWTATAADNQDGVTFYLGEIKYQ